MDRCCPWNIKKPKILSSGSVPHWVLGKSPAEVAGGVSLLSEQPPDLSCPSPPHKRSVAHRFLEGSQPYVIQEHLAAHALIEGFWDMFSPWPQRPSLQVTFRLFYWLSQISCSYLICHVSELPCSHLNALPTLKSFLFGYELILMNFTSESWRFLFQPLLLVSGKSGFEPRLPVIMITTF